MNESNHAAGDFVSHPVSKAIQAGEEQEELEEAEETDRSQQKSKGCTDDRPRQES